MALFAALAAVAVLTWALVSVYRAPVFKVKTVVVQGARHLSRSAVLGLAKLPPDVTLLRLPASAVERRLESDPWVAAATVERDFPSTVRLSITERRPVAVVDGGGTNLWVVSSDGTWLGRRSAEESSVVVIRDVGNVKPLAGSRAGSKELLNAIRVASGISPELSALTRAISAPTVEKTALITEEDIEIYFGEATDLKAKDRVAREILKRERGKVVYINVRVVDRPTWRGLGDSE